MFKLPQQIADICKEHRACVSGAIMLEAIGHKLPSGEPFRSPTCSIYIDKTVDLESMFGSDIEDNNDNFLPDDVDTHIAFTYTTHIASYRINVHAVKLPHDTCVEELMYEIVRKFDAACIRGYFDPDGNIHTTLSMRNAIKTSSFRTDKIALHRLITYRQRGFDVTYEKLNDELVITESTRREIFEYMSARTTPIGRCLVCCDLSPEEFHHVARVCTMAFDNCALPVQILHNYHVFIENCVFDYVYAGQHCSYMRIVKSRGTVYKHRATRIDPDSDCDITVLIREDM